MLDINKIVSADCLNYLPIIPDASIDFVFFSPPYDTIRDYGKNWSVDFHKLGEELYRVIKPGGVCAIVINDGTKNFAKSLTTSRLIVDWCDSLGWKLFETCLYQRHGNPGAWWTQRFRVDHEYLLFFFKGPRPKTFDKSHLLVPSKHAGLIYTGTDRQTDGSLKKINPKAVNPLKCRGTIWNYASSNSEGNKLKSKHPATFPDLLAQDVIGCFSLPGEIVLDPFAGSGTTCVISKVLGRNYIGIDINQDYVDIANQRLLIEAP